MHPITKPTGLRRLVPAVIAAMAAVALMAVAVPADAQEVAAEPVDQALDLSRWTVGDPHTHAAGDAGIGQPFPLGGNLLCDSPPPEWLEGAESDEDKQRLRDDLKTESTCAKFVVDEVSKHAADNGLNWVILTEHVPWLGARGLANVDWDGDQAERQWKAIKSEADATSAETGVAMLMGQEIGTAAPLSTNGHFGMYSGEYIGHSPTIRNEDKFLGDVRTEGGWGVINHPNIGDKSSPAKLANGSPWHCWFNNDLQSKKWPCSNAVSANLDLVKGVELLSGTQSASKGTLEQVDALLSIGATMSFIGSGDVHTSSRDWYGPRKQGEIDEVGRRGRTWTNTGPLSPGDGFDSTSDADPVRQAIKRGATVATTGPLAVPRIGAATPGDTHFVESGTAPVVEVHWQPKPPIDSEERAERPWLSANPSLIRIVSGSRYQPNCINGPNSECSRFHRTQDVYPTDIDFNQNPVRIELDGDIDEETWVRVEVHWNNRSSTVGGAHLDDDFFNTDSRGLPIRYQYATYASPIYLRPVISVENPATASAVMLVIDVSGSMEGERLQGAKTAAIDYLQGLEPGTTVGVRTYPSAGAQDDEGCSQGRLLVPPGNPDPTAASLAVRGLRADGGTPTSAALRSAVDDLVQLGVGSATLVLISDGESNCPDEGQACDVARDLAAKNGIKLHVPTIAFNITDAGRPELQCIANVTSAPYVEADSNDQLIARTVQFSQPQLELSRPMLSEPDDNGEITASVTVSSVGGTPARDVRVELMIDSGQSEAPRVQRERVGNLQPGESRTATWTFTPPLEGDDREYAFNFEAKGDNTPTNESTGRAVERLAVASPLVQASMTGPLATAERIVTLGDGFADVAGCDGSELRTGLVFWAERISLGCAGATVADLYLPSDGDRPPGQLHQLEALADPTDGVVVTLGAADIGLLALHNRCLVVTSCHAETIQPRCQDQQACPEGWSIEEEMRRRSEGVSAELARVYTDINRAINNGDDVGRRDGRTAPLIVLGYPQLMPPSLDGKLGCATMIEPEERLLLATATTMLNSSIQATVEELRRLGTPIYFVATVAEAFGPDHSLCDLSSHVVGLGEVRSSTSIPGDVDSGPEGLVIKPNADGYVAISAALSGWTDTVDWDAPFAAASNDLDLPSSKQSSDERLDGLDDESGGAPASVVAGRSYEIEGDGFQPGIAVGVRLGAGSRLVGSAIADVDGGVRATITIPEDQSLGDSIVSLHGSAADLSRLTVTRPVSVSVAREILWLGISGGSLALLALGAVLLFVVGRRSPLVA